MFFFHKKYSFKSNLTAKDLSIKLNNFFKRDDFLGEINGNSFKVNRRPAFQRNAFMPYFFGEINDTETGSEVKITARSSYVVSVICTIWSFIMIFSPIILEAVMFFSGEEVLIEFLLVPAFAIIIISAIVVFGFVLPLRSVSKELQDAIEKD
ncbi:MAG: hypothetical protein J6C61_08340 [Clostridia bacterium]|nr:hypothetical protein [Clostridia bacterium]